jgi:hypothetical protein
VIAKPDDIPQDAWDAARDAGQWIDFDMQVEATARAILAERERCAKVPALSGEETFADLVIAAIRNGGEA